MARTYKRKCLKDYEIIEGENRAGVKKGKEYLTSSEHYGKVTVFTNFWFEAPAGCFSVRKKIFTK